MNAKDKIKNPGQRRCPGEKYEITKAICNARQANDYPKCVMCSFAGQDGQSVSGGDPKIKKSIFRTSFIAGETPGEINDYVMRKVGFATAQYLRARNDKQGTIAIGCDKRGNSRNFSRIFGEGAQSAGMKVIHIGPAMPDMIRFAMEKNNLDAAVFISGCNARAAINGVRIINSDGRPILYNSGLEKIGLIARRIKAGRKNAQNKNETLRVLPDYRDFLNGYLPGLSPLKAVIDCSSGIGGEIVPYVLAKTPLEITKTHGDAENKSELLGLRFPAGQVNTIIQQAIREQNAHLGMAIDYDGDMCVFYDDLGIPLRNDIAAALIAGEMLELNPGVRIAYDLRATAAFREEVLKAGGQPLRTSTAPGRFCEAVIAKNAVYAFDLNGKHMFKAFNGGESPLMAFLLLCRAVAKKQLPLSALAQDVQRYAYSGIISHEMPTPEKAAAAVETLNEEFADAEKDDLDGITFRFPSWWFNVKHVPESRIIKVCVEGPSENEEKEGRHAVEEIINQYQDQG